MSSESWEEQWRGVLAILFPAGLDPVAVDRVRDAVGAAPPTRRSVRIALGVLDQQTSPSPVTVRWAEEDLAEVDVDGVRMAIDTADASVSVQILAGAYEPHVAATLDRILGAGDVFVDVGANVGYHSFRAVRRIGPTGRVIAVEANPENARLIARTIDANSLTNVELVPLALSDRRGHVVFGSHLGTNGGFLGDAGAASASGRSTIVPTTRLDDLDLDRVSVVKIDVEGAEALVVDGCGATVARERPTFVMEFSREMTERVSGRSAADHLARFVDWNYTVSIIDRATSEARPVVSIDAMLDGWGDLARIEDLLLVPAER